MVEMAACPSSARVVPAVGDRGAVVGVGEVCNERNENAGSPPQPGDLAGHNEGAAANRIPTSCSIQREIVVDDLPRSLPGADMAASTTRLWVQVPPRGRQSKCGALKCGKKEATMEGQQRCLARADAGASFAHRCPQQSVERQQAHKPTTLNCVPASFTNAWENCYSQLLGQRTVGLDARCVHCFGRTATTQARPRAT